MDNLIFDLIKQENLDEIKKNTRENIKPNIKHLYIIFAIKYCKNLDTIRYLVEEVKSNYNANNKQRLLLISCRSSSNTKIIEYFEKLNKGVNLENVCEENCLHMAITGNKNPHIIKYLVEEKKMDVNKITKCKNNSLTLACKIQNFEIIKYLICETNVNINYINDEGENALLICFKQQNLNHKIINFLITKTKININACDKNGNNCLYYACTNNTISLETITLLFTYGIDINSKPKNNFTYLSLAYRNLNDPQILKYLTNGIQMEKIWN
jgi:hypothetical protein